MIIKIKSVCMCYYLMQYGINRVILFDIIVIMQTKTIILKFIEYTNYTYYTYYTYYIY